jgi:hypothetical protein
MIVLKQLEKVFVKQTNYSVQLAILTAPCVRSERVASTAAVYQNIKSTFIDDG